MNTRKISALLISCAAAFLGLSLCPKAFASGFGSFHGSASYSHGSSFGHAFNSYSPGYSSFGHASSSFVHASSGFGSASSSFSHASTGSPRYSYYQSGSTGRSHISGGFGSNYYSMGGYMASPSEIQYSSTNYCPSGGGNYADHSYHSYRGYASASQAVPVGYSQSVSRPIDMNIWHHNYQHQEIPSLFAPGEVIPISLNRFEFSEAKPAENIDKSISKVEDRLIKLHAEERLGTLDIDKYSEELLALKRNYGAMLSDKVSLSPKQEVALRNEISALNTEIERQIRSTF